MNTPAFVKSSFTLLEAMTVIAVIALLAIILFPKYVKARTMAQKNACIANLKQLQSVVQGWALENKKTTGSIVTTANITFYLKDGVLPAEPAGGFYSVTTIDAKPTCSLSATMSHTL